MWGKEWGERKAIGRAYISGKDQNIYKFLGMEGNMMVQGHETKLYGYRTES